MKCIGLIVSAAAVSLATPAIAASADYLLVIDGADGAAPASAKISSWSFGATQTSNAPMSGKRTGKPNIGSSGQDGVISPRDHGSGMPVGRKSGAVVAADFKRLPQVDEVDGLVVVLPADSGVTQQLCGETDHLRSGHISEPDGTVYDLSSVKAVCAKGTPEGVPVHLFGIMKHKNYTGHVTLMK